MSDNFLLNAVHTQRSHYRKKKLIILAFSGMVVLFTIFGIYKLSSDPEYAKSTAQEISSPDNAAESPNPSEEAMNQPRKETAPTEAQTAPTATNNSENQSMSAINAQLCKDSLSSAREKSSFLNNQLFKTLADYSEIYKGNINSPDALTARQQAKDYTKQQYQDYFNLVNPTLKSVCGADASAADVMTQPNYNSL
jgi:hypothetical protein